MFEAVGSNSKLATPLFHIEEAFKTCEHLHAATAPVGTCGPTESCTWDTRAQWGPWTSTGRPWQGETLPFRVDRNRIRKPCPDSHPSVQACAAFQKGKEGVPG